MIFANGATAILQKLNQANLRIAELEVAQEQYIQAIGIMATLKPTMEMDINHPVDMALEVYDYVTRNLIRTLTIQKSAAHMKTELDIKAELIDKLYNRLAKEDDLP
jgi:hypothetical protein